MIFFSFPEVIYLVSFPDFFGSTIFLVSFLILSGVMSMHEHIYNRIEWQKEERIEFDHLINFNDPINFFLNLKEFNMKLDRVE